MKAYLKLLPSLQHDKNLRMIWLDMKSLYEFLLDDSDDLSHPSLQHSAADIFSAYKAEKCQDVMPSPLTN
jgi:hypothetical protein